MFVRLRCANQFLVANSRNVCDVHRLSGWYHGCWEHGQRNQRERGPAESLQVIRTLVGAIRPWVSATEAPPVHVDPVHEEETGTDPLCDRQPSGAGTRARRVLAGHGGSPQHDHQPV